jgi:hypothetical protein
MNVTGPQYHSPAMLYDPLAQVVIIQRLDPDTGKVLAQTPTEATVKHDRIVALGGTSSPVTPVKADLPPAAAVRPVAAGASSGPQAERAAAPAIRLPVSLLV